MKRRKIVSFFGCIICFMLLSLMGGVMTGSGSAKAVTSSDGSYDYKILDDGVSVEITLYKNKQTVTDVIIPEKIDGKTVVGIQKTAFSWSAIKSLVIPKTITNIDEAAFIDTKKLMSIKVDVANPVYDSREDCNAIIETGTNTLIKGCKGTHIPEDITAIGTYAFYMGYGQSSLALPEGVISIGKYAFESNSILTTASIPNSVTSIGYKAFNNCKELVILCHRDSCAHQYANDNKIAYRLIEGGEDENLPKAACSNMFYDIDYTEPVSGSAVVVCGNAVKKKEGSVVTASSVFTAYTDVLASYQYKTDNKGRIKGSTGKVVAGLTMSDIRPTLTNKGKIVDAEASKIATAKIKNGVVTVNATGKMSGTVYLWIIDTGRKGMFETCPITVKLLPKKMVIVDQGGQKITKPFVENGGSLVVQVQGMVGTVKAESGTYTATVNSNSNSYVKVEPIIGTKDLFTITGTGLKNGKDTQAGITFICAENGKKVKLMVTVKNKTE